MNKVRSSSSFGMAHADMHESIGLSSATPARMSRGAVVATLILETQHCNIAKEQTSGAGA